jgi:hypothetical protein
MWYTVRGNLQVCSLGSLDDVRPVHSVLQESLQDVAHVFCGTPLVLARKKIAGGHLWFQCLGHRLVPLKQRGRATSGASKRSCRAQTVEYPAS